MSFIDTITNNRLWSKHSVKLVWLLAILFFTTIMISIIWNAWNLSKVKQSNYQTQELEPIAQSTQPGYNVSDITNANLFGDPAPPVVVEDAPETTLDLTLEGVLWSSDNTTGRAIIMVGKKAAELYSVGEEINGAGASVDEIRDGEIILNRNGVFESLPLIKLTTSGNREIITFVDDPLPEDYLNFDGVQVPAQPNVITPPNDTNTTRSVRRPNFSGLDRALEKIGDL